MSSSSLLVLVGPGRGLQDNRVLTYRSATTRSVPDGSLPELIRRA